ncbi:uncharacterized protein LOC133196412 [Saccostrea echinata]|uniref:uncharacterized protein LOC133196412 n=1 Tax=Saccostrea echinata TaxID=191078 RepID=UPI002A81B860|nr:uncharacterized protein LOC133196412 [Saccostrea echinata]XP_061188290.1 uncharacterized protein LOC133196412 [Saccostrea echinata]
MPEKPGKRESKNESKGEPKFLTGKMYDILPEIPEDRKSRPKKAAKRPSLGKMYDILPSIGPNVYSYEDFQKMYEDSVKSEDALRKCLHAPSSDAVLNHVTNDQELAEASTKRSSSPLRDVKKRRMPKRARLPDT